MPTRGRKWQSLRITTPGRKQGKKAKQGKSRKLGEPLRQIFFLYKAGSSLYFFFTSGLLPFCFLPYKRNAPRRPECRRGAFRPTRAEACGTSTHGDEPVKIARASRRFFSGFARRYGFRITSFARRALSFTTQGLRQIRSIAIQPKTSASPNRDAAHPLTDLCKLCAAIKN